MRRRGMRPPLTLLEKDLTQPKLWEEELQNEAAPCEPIILNILQAQNKNK